jgi:hypothetical protein
MKPFIVLIALCVFLAGCTKQAETSRFNGLDIKVGMNRDDVERKVAVLLNTQKTYSPYGNNLSGGVVQYRDGQWILEIRYQAGSPAPWIKNADGTAEHNPPVDETVIEYKIEKNPDAKGR